MENTDVRVLVFNEKNQILLVLERGGVKTIGGRTFEKPSRWGLPGGRSEPKDEDEIDTGRREAEEETGLWIDINPRYTLVRLGDNCRKVVLFGYPVAGQIRINPEEILDCRWFTKSVLWDEKFDMYNGHRRMAQELLQKLGR